MPKTKNKNEHIAANVENGRRKLCVKSIRKNCNNEQISLTHKHRKKFTVKCWKSTEYGLEKNQQKKTEKETKTTKKKSYERKQKKTERATAAH